MVVPIQGDGIKNSFMTSEEEFVTTTMIKDALDVVGSGPLIEFSTLKFKVSFVLGSNSNIRLLEAYEESSDDFLQIEEPGIYVQAMWDQYFG